jgi:uncharacterized integral membrane protein
LSGAARSAGSLFRKITAAVVLIPLAVVIVAFAVANRQTVTLSLDPFNAERPAASLSLPLYLLIIGLLIVGVIVGGVATWLNHGRWRRAARRLEREAQDLRDELASLRRGAGTAPRIAEPSSAPERLQLRPPAH